jgi:hypothetical protein
MSILMPLSELRVLQGYFQVVNRLQCIQMPAKAKGADSVNLQTLLVALVD